MVKLYEEDANINQAAASVFAIAILHVLDGQKPLMERAVREFGRENMVKAIKENTLNSDATKRAALALFGLGEE